MKSSRLHYRNDEAWAETHEWQKLKKYVKEYGFSKPTYCGQMRHSNTWNKDWPVRTNRIDTFDHRVIDLLSPDFLHRQS